MRRFTTAALLLSLLIPISAFGQLKKQAEPVSFSKLLTDGPAGLVGMIGLNPNRFSMSHSYSISMISGGGNSFSQGVYLNTMGYQISDAMSFALQWGILHQPMSSFGVTSPYQDGFFFSGASFEYKPSDKLAFGIQVSQTPQSYYDSRWYYNNPYSSPFRKSSSFFKTEENVDSGN